MITITRRMGWAGFFAGLALSWGSTARAQERTPFPALSDKHVYVSGVPDRYQAIESQINQLERSSPQTYYVVVVKKAGSGSKAAMRYAEELFDLWRSQAAKSRRTFDADRSILIVLAVDDSQIAVHPGALLRNQFGLTPAKIERDLIRDVFIPFAQKEQYPEGLAAPAFWSSQRDERRDRSSRRLYGARAGEDHGVRLEQDVKADDQNDGPHTQCACYDARAGGAGCATRDSWQSGDSATCSAGALVGQLDVGPGGRGSHGRDRFALDRWCTLVGVPPHAIARGRADQGCEIEGGRCDGSPRRAQRTAQAAAELARISRADCR